MNFNIAVPFSPAIPSISQGYYIQVVLRMTSRLAGLIFAIQKGSGKHNSICLC